MGRVINSQPVGKQRQALVRAVVLALRELMSQKEPGEAARDLAAFIGLTLEEIAATIDKTVGPWETRGYWVKADRFRLQWDWTAGLGESMRQAVRGDDWPQVAALAARIGERLKGEQVPRRHRLGTPWVGAWERLVGGDRQG